MRQTTSNRKAGQTVKGVIDGWVGATRVASNFPTLQSAIDDLPETGGSVYVPPGVYQEAIQIRTPNVTLLGTWDSIVKTPDNAEQLVNDAAIRVLADGCRIEGIQIDGNKVNNPALDGPTNGPARWADGVGVYANDCTITKCYIHDMLGHGIIVWNEGFDDIPKGSRQNIIIDGNIIKNGKWRSHIDIASTDPTAPLNQKVTISNNVCIGTEDAPTGNEHGITTHTAQKVMIIGNHVENLSNGLNIHTGSIEVVAQANTVTNSINAGILVDNNSDKISCITNTIKSISSVGRGVIVRNSTDVCISGNDIDAELEAIWIRGATEKIFVTDNRASSELESCILISDDINYVEVSRNRISAPFTKQGIRDLPTSAITGNLITGNYIYAGAQGIASTTPHTDISGNVIDGATVSGILVRAPNIRVSNNRINGTDRGIQFDLEPANVILDGNKFISVADKLFNTPGTNLVEVNSFEQ